MSATIENAVKTWTETDLETLPEDGCLHEDFFSRGTQLAWLIGPSAQRLEICRSLTQRRLLGPDGVLKGEEVLPDFQYPVADRFKEWEW